MIGHVTFSIESTHSWTWVFTVLVYTGLVSWALRIGDTFRFTFNVGIANIVPDALASSSIAIFKTLSISSTRRWVAWFDDFYWSFSSCPLTARKWISSVSRITNTKWSMISDFAMSISSTQPRTWIHTFLVSA
jgi:hypothetical protein